MRLREPLIKKLLNTRQEDTEEIYELFVRPETQRTLQMYIQKIK
ncbi:hypothetical protein KGM_205252 [Danaus plexippus plexippus]|uniref:Uncharacterized protein n=1 Tax=Danaus plexippus plexippus TaxID=278856 RepID=A0A212FPH3_DANPL|nr:hypothetical protein KGM_205252 [Danaus plexippus plexippus]